MWYTLFDTTFVVTSDFWRFRISFLCNGILGTEFIIEWKQILHATREVEGNWPAQNLNTKRVGCDALFGSLKENRGEDFARCVRDGRSVSEKRLPYLKEYL
jgi:hypothetical protein